MEKLTHKVNMPQVNYEHIDDFKLHCGLWSTSDDNLPSCLRARAGGLHHRGKYSINNKLALGWCISAHVDRTFIFLILI